MEARHKNGQPEWRLFKRQMKAHRVIEYVSCTVRVELCNLTSGSRESGHAQRCHLLKGTFSQQPLLTVFFTPPPRRHAATPRHSLSTPLCSLRTLRPFVSPLSRNCFYSIVDVQLRRRVHVSRICSSGGWRHRTELNDFQASGLSTLLFAIEIFIFLAFYSFMQVSASKLRWNSNLNLAKPARVQSRDVVRGGGGNLEN